MLKWCVQVKLWDPLRTRARSCHTWVLLWWWLTMKRRYIKCTHLYLCQTSTAAQKPGRLLIFLTYSAVEPTVGHTAVCLWCIDTVTADIPCGSSIVVWRMPDATIFTGWTFLTASNYRLCVTVYKCLHGMAPQYLSDLCTPVAEVPGRQRLRSADRGQLQTPLYRLTTFGGRSFTCAAPSIWNALPDYLKDTALSLSYFEKQLKTFLFSRY